MSTKDWGGCTWCSMHQLVIGYSNNPTYEEKNSMRMYFHSLAKILPCEDCKYDFAQLLKKHPPNVTNSCTLQNWLFHMHNMVNERLGKPIFTVNQYKKKYAHSIEIHKQRKQRGE